MVANYEAYASEAMHKDEAGVARCSTNGSKRYRASACVMTGVPLEKGSGLIWSNY